MIVFSSNSTTCPKGYCYGNAFLKHIFTRNSVLPLWLLPFCDMMEQFAVRPGCLESPGVLCMVTRPERKGFTVTELRINSERQRKTPMEFTIDKKTFYRNLLRLALPISLQSLMLALVAAGDALMLGRVAQNEMTAVSLATQIQFVQNMFLMAVTGAGAILGAQYWGKGDRRTLENIFNIKV